MPSRLLLRTGAIGNRPELGAIENPEEIGLLEGDQPVSAESTITLAYDTASAHLFARE